MTWPFVIGLDLATEVDFTAVCVVEEGLYCHESESLSLNVAPGWVSPAQPGLTAWQLGRLVDLAMKRARPPDPPLMLRHLERMQGISYPAIVERVETLMRTPPLRP